MLAAHAIFVFVLVAVPTFGQSILYVDINATGPIHDGSSWCHGFVHLQDAIAAARESGELTAEIRVADGVYRPDRGAGQTLGDREASFEMLDGVALRGGYAGCAADDPNKRDIVAFETVLSGDLLGDDETGGTLVNTGDNARTVAFAESVGSAPILDGVTITRGGFGFSAARGPTLIDCKLEANLRAGLVTSRGGSSTMVRCQFLKNRLAAFHTSTPSTQPPNPRYVDCVFADNLGSRGGRGAGSSFGAGVVVMGGSASFLRCDFKRNMTFSFGGGVFVTGGSARFESCRFSQNASAGLGGAAAGENATLAFSSCQFTNNLARDGAGISTILGSLTIHGCTFTGNSATNHGGGIFLRLEPTMTMTNSALWRNTSIDGTSELSQIFLFDGATPSTVTINHSLVQGWTGAFGGVGNIGGDPLFVDALGPDGIGGTEDDDLRLRRGSPCIDAGDNAAVPMDDFDLDGDGDFGEPTPFDFAGRVRFVNDPLARDTGSGDRPVVDMGALERQVVLLDIRPGHCPNRFNPRSRGLMKIAVVGAPTFDVTQIDRDSLTLTSSDEDDSIRPTFRKHGRKHRRAFRDVTAPLNGDLCDCRRARRDGVLDLILWFSRRDVAELLEEDDHRRGESVVLTLTGRTLDGEPFEASDCLRIVNRHDR